MTRFSSADVGFLLIDGRNVLGETTELEDNLEALTEDTTVLGSTWEEHTAIGVKRYDLSQKGFYNDAAGASNEALINIGAGAVLSFAPEGNVAGKPMISSPGIEAKYTRTIKRAELHKANAEYKSTGAHDEGVIIHPLGAETASSGDTEDAAIDNGASSAAGGAGVLQVNALTLGGYDDVTVKIRHSADDITYADLITFAAVDAAPDAERVAVAGTVNRYLADSYTFNGSGSGQSITYATGFARN